MHVQSDWTTCPACGVTFEQAHDPGRRRKFCSNACRQRDYRARNAKNGHEAADARRAREEQERAARAEEARRRRAREREAQARRSGVSWTLPRSSDDAATARSRARCAKLLDRANHPRTPAEEAASCRALAERIRTARGL